MLVHNRHVEDSVAQYSDKKESEEGGQELNEFSVGACLCGHLVQQVQTCMHETGTWANTHTNQLTTVFMISIHLIGKLK